MQVAQSQQQEQRKDKYRDPDRFPREELRREIERIVAISFQAYLEAEARRGNMIALESLMRDNAFGWIVPPSERPPLEEIGTSERLLDRTRFSMDTNPIFRRSVNMATYMIESEVLACNDAQQEPR